MKEKTKKRWPRILLLLILAAAVGGGVFLKIMKDSGRYFRNTLLNGVDISGLTAAQAADRLDEAGARTRVVLTENDETALEGSLADFGYSLDRQRLSETLAMALQIQRADLSKMIGSLIHGDAFLLELPYVCDEDVLSEKAVSSALEKERVPSKDARLKYKKKKQQYTIKPEVYGNEIRDEDLAALVREELNRFTSGRRVSDTLTIPIPDSVYIKPEVTSETRSLVNRRNVYNMYCKASIVHTFGSTKEVLDWHTIKDWLQVKDGYGVFDEEKAMDYIYNLEAVYNTRYRDRIFHTTPGNDILIDGSGNEYGYTIDEEAEMARMFADFASNQTVEREPVYFETNSYGNPLYYKREGTDDLAGTYVEIDLSRQHLWFYIDGMLITESDFVSGNVSSHMETQTGVFPLAYKESPSILTGGNAENGYRTEVKYWMPFYEGQGMHDATWRGSFGGQIYQSNGSHGCVNLPLSAAESIYNSIQAGMAIVIYK